MFDIVPHLVCKGNMVVPYLDFRKPSEPALPMPRQVT